MHTRGHHGAINRQATGMFGLSKKNKLWSQRPNRMTPLKTINIQEKLKEAKRTEERRRSQKVLLLEIIWQTSSIFAWLINWNILTFVYLLIWIYLLFERLVIKYFDKVLENRQTFLKIFMAWLLFLLVYKAMIIVIIWANTAFTFINIDSIQAQFTEKTTFVGLINSNYTGITYIDRPSFLTLIETFAPEGVLVLLALIQLKHWDNEKHKEKLSTEDELLATSMVFGPKGYLFITMLLTQGLVLLSKPWIGMLFQFIVVGIVTVISIEKTLFKWTKYL